MNDNVKTLYQVWHKEPQGYVHAFTVHSKDMLTALVLPMIEPRSSAVGVEAPATRPTTFGDVIVTPNNDAYVVAKPKHGLTFDLVDFAQLKADATTHAQLREDFQMGQEEAARGEFAGSVRQLADFLCKPSAVESPAKDEGIER